VQSLFFISETGLQQALNFQPIQYQGKTKGEYNFKMFLSMYQKIDSINYFIYPDSYVDLRGASGSAVFQQMPSGNCVFGGVYTASNPDGKIYILVRPENILKRIQGKRVVVSMEN